LRVLFDQNAPRPLARFLVKHEITRSAELGWEELPNGDLLSAAESNGFEVMVTADRNIRYQQNLAKRTIALVILPSGRWPLVKKRLREVVAAVDDSQPGDYRDLPLRKS
jgi:hypothetical protein